MQNIVTLKTFLIISLFFLVLLTLSGGFGYYAPRSLKELWNLGHILLFTLLSIYLLRYNDWFSSKKFSAQIFILLFVVLLLSFVIEGLQFVLANGTPDINDVRRNLSGAAFGFVLFRRISSKIWQYSLKILVIIWCVLELMPSGRALADEFIAYRQFPLLADFESSLEMSRWSGSASFERSRERVYSGNYSLKIHFGTRKYSGVSLVHFPGNWEGYKYLKFAVYYPGPDSLRFTCRVHDNIHIKGKQEYHDRFNRNFVIKSGWNNITIPLTDIKNAPASRTMNMRDIMGFGIFTVQLKKPLMAYIDGLRLE